MTRVLLVLSICLAIHVHQIDASFSGFLSMVFTTLKGIFQFAKEVKTLAEDYHLISPTESDGSAAIELRQTNEGLDGVSERLGNVEEGLSWMAATGADLANQTKEVNAGIKNVSRTLEGVNKELSSISLTGAQLAVGIRGLNAAMKDVSRKLYNVEENLIIEIDQLRATLLQRLPLAVQHDARLQQLSTRINEVNDVYDHFMYYSNTSHSYEVTTITEFMTDLVRHSSKLNNALDSVHAQLLSDEQISPNLLSVIIAAGSHDEDNHEQRCGGISPQQELYKIHQTIMLTEMQGYAMNVYAFGVLKQVHNVSYTGELNKLENRFKRRGGEYLRSVKSAMSAMSTEMRLCQPANDTRGVVNTSRLARLRVNTNSQTSDVHENMVVIGVRMVMESDMLNLQIEQGKLIQRGEIETVNQPWKPIEQSSPGSRYLGIVTLERPYFNLDEIIVPDNFVITGVRLAHLPMHFQRGEIVLEVHATKYNPDTGKLKRWNSLWLPVLPRSGPGIRGTFTGVDVRPVTAGQRPIALSGMGGYLSASDRSLGLRLFEWNMASNMKTDLS